MNIQIFGTNKSQDTKKAIRFFKERNIKFQFIDLKEKEMSKGEFNSVCAALGGYENLIDENAKDKDALALIKYISKDCVIDKILKNQQILKLPIVRNGRVASVGVCMEVWKSWE